MDINELESYRLQDAIKFNERLNPKIWGDDEQMLPSVRNKLMEIADDFREFLGVTGLELKDITVSGSNAAYTYTPHSDIDLHLVVDLPQDNEVYRELFDAKKYQYNDQHNFKIGGYDVELYVQDAAEPAVSQGIYSILNDTWISVPKRRKPDVDDISVKSKYEDLGHRIEQAIASGDLATMDAMAKKVRALRQSGLDQTGEFGPENLAFKILRANGTLDQLRQARLAAKDREMSLAERDKLQERFRYGFGESSESNDIALIKDFVKFASHKLNIVDLPKMKLVKKPTWAEKNNTFGRYVPEENTLYVSMAGRHIVDTMRTIAHELTHHQQHQIGNPPDTAGETGSPWENEANAMAGVIMREWNNLHPEMFSGNAINENGDEVNEPMPGKPLSFPKGTVEVDVSDVYDWYKIGQSISDLDDADPQDFGQGPPHTILSFGDEKQEHRYAKDLQRLGLKMHDLDEAAINESSGYIPVNAEEARDPRYSMAMSVDIKPKELQRQAAKLGFKTDDAGVPPLLIKDLTNLLESVKKDNPQKQKFVWADHNELPMESIMDIAEGYFLKNTNLFETNSNETVQYFQGLFDLGQKPVIGSKYLLTLLILINDRVTIAQEPIIGKVVEQQGQHEYTVELPDNRLVKFPYQILRDKAIYNVWFFNTNDNYNKLRSAIALKFSVDLPAVKFNESVQVYSGSASKQRGLTQAKTPEDVKQALNYLLKINEPTPEASVDRAVEMLSQRQTSPTVTNVLDALKQIVRKFKLAVSSETQSLLNREITESEELFEVKMSPGALKKWAESGEAKGILAGFEAEFIFKDTENENSDQDQEPDYDQDRRARSIEDVVEFFGDDGGMFNSQSDLNKLKERLGEEYVQWRSERFSEEFWNDRLEIVREYMDMNVWDPEKEERIRGKLEENDYSEEEIDRIMAAGENAPMSAKQSGKHQQEYADTHKDFKLFLDASESAYEDFGSEVEEEVKVEGPIYDDAQQYWLDMAWDGPDYDEAEFLRDNYRHMSDIPSSFTMVTWPYWSGGGGYGARTFDEIAESLADVVDAPVKTGSAYHSVKRAPGVWVLEPDGSLEPNDPTSQVGLEVVSPPLPLAETLQKMQEVLYWANIEADAYTNDSTGLHMGISLPNQDENTIDFVKLVLFLGDQHILKKFGRLGNTYCQSAYSKLKERMSSIRPELREDGAGDPIDRAFDQMRKSMQELATRELRGSVGQGKYTSVHDHGNYIEFRSPGGDYIGNRKMSDITETMLRFARAMSIAGNPEAEKQEYAKKLYKLLTNPKFKSDEKSGQKTVESSDPFMKLFAQYSAGDITGQELKQQWVSTVADVASKEKKPYGQQPFEIYNWETQEPLLIVYGKNETDAFEKGLPQVPDNVDNEKIAIGGVSPKWDIYNTDTGEVLRVIRGYSEAQANEVAMMQFSGKGINFAVRKHDSTTEKSSRREKLAKKIAARPQQTKTMGERIIDVYRGLYPTGYVHGLKKFSVDFKYLDKDGQKVVNDTTEVFAHDPLAANDAVIKLVRDAGHLVKKEDVSSEEIVNTRGAQERQQVQNMDTQIQSGSMRWAILNSHTGDVLFTFWNRADQGSANQYAADWLRRNNMINGQFEVVPVR